MIGDFLIILLAVTGFVLTVSIFGMVAFIIMISYDDESEIHSKEKQKIEFPGVGVIDEDRLKNG